MILLLSMLDKAEDWVVNHLPYFYKNKKSLMEYCQMKLYDSSFDKESLGILISYYDSEYHSLSDLLKSKEPYYRKIEYLALLSLFSSPESNSFKLKINEIFYNGFLYKLLIGDISLEILSSREHLYVITHDIFYSTLFSRDIHIFRDTDVIEEKIKVILEYALLISIKNKDIDVLMELLCCVCILKISILDFILELSLELLQTSQEKDGYFIYDEDRESFNIKEYFSKVYHTTLVGCILKKVIQNNAIKFEDIVYRRNYRVKISVAKDLLNKMNTESIDLLYRDIRFNFQKHREKLSKLTNYGEIFVCIALVELFKEHYENAEKLLFICNYLEIEIHDLYHRLYELKSSGGFL